MHVFILAIIGPRSDIGLWMAVLAWGKAEGQYAILRPIWLAVGL